MTDWVGELQGDDAWQRKLRALERLLQALEVAAAAESADYALALADALDEYWAAMGLEAMR